MKTYLVGGAIRDKLLELDVYDKDYVVVGATPEQMLSQGYEAVGKQFPVFLHPRSHEEYALARSERKTGAGYTGFECISDPSITLKEDLLRRDLSINAMAEDDNGNIIDPYGGQADIANKQLRHVSDAFIEDPLRVLRVARFHAKLAHLGFSVHPNTLALMQNIAASDELETLSAERLWTETEKAFSTQSPHVYIQTLRDCGALRVLMPEVDALFGVPQRPEHHPEIDCGIHTLMVIEQASLLIQAFTATERIKVLFAALCHDLGKALTPDDVLPRHLMHEKRGIKPVKQLCKRLKVPNDATKLALLVCEFHLHCHRAFELKASTILKLFKSLDGSRAPQRLPLFLMACEADAKGRTGFENNDYPQADFLQRCFDAAASISAQSFTEDERRDLQGKAFGEAIDNKRIAAIQIIKQEHAAS